MFNKLETCGTLTGKFLDTGANAPGDKVLVPFSGETGEETLGIGSKGTALLKTCEPGYSNVKHVQEL